MSCTKIMHITAQVYMHLVHEWKITQERNCNDGALDGGKVKMKYSYLRGMAALRARTLRAAVFLAHFCAKQGVACSLPLPITVLMLCRIATVPF